jgi:hypothetical protein
MEPEPTQWSPRAMSSLMRQEFFMRRGVLSTPPSSWGRHKCPSAHGKAAEHGHGDAPLPPDLRPWWVRGQFVGTVIQGLLY